MDDARPAPQTPDGRPFSDVRIGCSDTRFRRMLEIEASPVGLTLTPLPPAPASLGALPAGAPGLLLLDLDEYPFPAPLPEGTRLLGWSRRPERLPAPSEGVILLRRPFALPDFRRALLTLLPETWPRVPLRLPPDADAGSVKEPPAPPRLAWADEADTLLLDGAPLKLTPSESLLLHTLMDSPGVVFSRESLRTLLGTTEGNVVDVYICRLRAKLEKPLGLRLFTAVRGKGYTYGGLPDADN